MESALRILIIRLGAVGDVVRTMTALRPLRRLAPRARLFWIAEEGPSALLADHPLLEEVLVLPRRTIAAGLAAPDTVFEALAGTAALVRELRRRRFDLALDFHGTFKSGLVSRASGAKRRWGYAPPGSKELNRLFNTDHVTLPDGPLHRVRRVHALLRALGASVSEDEVAVDLPIGPAQVRRVEAWLEERGAAGDPLVLFHPGTSARQAYKRYPADRLARAASLIAREAPHRLVVAGGPGEEELLRIVAEGAGERALPASGFGLLELAELIRRCDLFVGPDTGPMHIAWAAGTRVLALFGPTDPALNAPWGPGHALLYNDAPRSRRRPSWPDAEEVARVALAMLGGSGKPGVRERPGPAAPASLPRPMESS